MESVLKQTLKAINNGFELGKKLYLINGKSCSGKTQLANEIVSFFNKKDKLNPLLKSFIINGSFFSNFFSLTSLNDYKIIKIPIENTKISIDFSQKKNINIHPFPESNAYKDIFREHKYIDKNKNFSYNKNLLIIDDCEKVNLLFYYILDKALKLIFNENEFFGGIHVILIGNSKVNTNFENIFSSALYNNHKNIYKLFDLLSINNVKTKFSVSNYSLEYYNLYSFFIKDEIQNRSGILKKKDKLFFKKRDIDIYKKDFKNEIYFSDNYEEINNHNMKIIKNNNNKKYKMVATKLFNDECVSKDKLKYFYKYYEHFFDPLILFENLKIIFTSSISDINIKRGQIGYIKKINFKKEIPDSLEFIDIDEYLQNIIVEVDGINKNINLKKTTNIETGLSFKFLPINSGYCVHFKYLSYLPKGNLILTKDTNIHIIESCINKITDIGFKNTDLLNYTKLFESSYSESIKNGIKIMIY